MAEKEDRVGKSVGILERVLDKYEKKHPHWRIEVLVSLIKWSVKSLKHYIEDARDKAITWEQPFVVLHYAVEWDWKESTSRGEKYGGLLYGKITDRNTSDTKKAVRTLSEIMARALNTMALADLTNWVRFAWRGNRETPYLVADFAEALASIRDKRKRRDFFNEITRPFSIGSALIECGTAKLTNGDPGHKKAASQPGSLPNFDLPSIEFSGNVNGREFMMSLEFRNPPVDNRSRL